MTDEDREPVIETGKTWKGRSQDEVIETGEAWEEGNRDDGGGEGPGDEIDIETGTTLKQHDDPADA